MTPAINYIIIAIILQIGTGGSLIPFDRDPAMSASIAPGFQSVEENKIFGRTLTVRDGDKWKQGEGEKATYPINRGGPVDIECTIRSGNQSSLLITLSGDNAQNHTWEYTITHKSKAMPEGVSEVFFDSYLIKDLDHSGAQFLKDDSLLLRQQVEVFGKEN